MFYQTGNLEQVEVISRSMLAAIPDDLVALQFLGLALYQMGHLDEAYRIFMKAVAKLNQHESVGDESSCELAGVVSYREATRAQSGLADGWHRIGQVLNNFGFHKLALRALEAEATARGTHVEGLPHIDTHE